MTTVHGYIYFAACSSSQPSPSLLPCPISIYLISLIRLLGFYILCFIPLLEIYLLSNEEGTYLHTLLTDLYAVFLDTPNSFVPCASSDTWLGLFEPGLWDMSRW